MLSNSQLPGDKTSVNSVAGVVNTNFISFIAEIKFSHDLQACGVFLLCRGCLPEQNALYFMPVTQFDEEL